MTDDRYYVIHNPFTCNPSDNILTLGLPKCSHCGIGIGSRSDIYMAADDYKIYCTLCATSGNIIRSYHSCSCKYASTKEMLTYDGWNLRNRIQILDSKITKSRAIYLVKEIDRESVARVICYDLIKGEMFIIKSATSYLTYSLLLRIFSGIQANWTMGSVNRYIESYFDS